DLGQLPEGFRRLGHRADASTAHTPRMRLPQPFRKFFADRGPHLAAMIAYFALLSFVPLLFLTVSLLGLAGRPDESSYLVTELKRAFPGSSVTSIVHTVDAIRKHSTALGIVGGAALIWASLSLFSVLESAMSIVYGQPNRSFLRGKLLAVGLMLLSLVTMFLGLIAGSFGFDLLKRYAARFAGNSYVAYRLSLTVSLLGAGAMRVARLPLVPELCDGSLLAVRDEDRVVAESLGPARLLGDPALEHTRSAHFLAVRAEQDELADVSRPPVLDTLQIVDEPR